jgi:hypothetical protein
MGPSVVRIGPPCFSRPLAGISTYPHRQQSGQQPDGLAVGGMSHILLARRAVEVDVGAIRWVGQHQPHLRGDEIDLAALRATS